VTNHAAKWACCAVHLDADLRLGQRDLGGLTAAVSEPAANRPWLWSTAGARLGVGLAPEMFGARSWCPWACKATKCDFVVIFPTMSPVTRSSKRSGNGPDQASCPLLEPYRRSRGPLPQLHLLSYTDLTSERRTVSIA
jgi:hypothetical protein